MYVPSSELGLSYPSLSRQRVCPSPRYQRGGHTRLRMRGWGGPNSDDWIKSLALCFSVMQTNRNYIKPPMKLKIATESRLWRAHLAEGAYSSCGYYSWRRGGLFGANLNVLCTLLVHCKQDPSDVFPYMKRRKSFTFTWMQEFGTRPLSFISGNICFNFF